MFFYWLMIFTRLLTFGSCCELAVKLNVLLGSRKELHGRTCGECSWLFSIHWSLFLLITLGLRVFVLGVAT